jgi:dethiobiotin synthetase
MTRRGFFITGTDTGVGKTVVSCALVRELRSAGYEVGVMKPVETGVSAAGPLDALALWEAAGQRDPLSEVCPFRYELPAAPSVAAHAEASAVSLETIRASFDRIASSSRVMVVEGAGGLLVPVSERVDMGQLAHELDLSLVLVARSTLGTINHTLLTLAEVERRALPLAGVVISHSAGRISTADASNLEFLRQRLGCKLVGEIPPLDPGELPSPGALKLEALVAALAA